jgi:hypothetical protein
VTEYTYKPCRFRVGSFFNRRVFTDEEGTLYLLELDRSLYGGLKILIGTYRFDESGKLIEVSAPRAEALIEYFKRLESKELERLLQEWIHYELEIPRSHLEALGEKFCRYWIDDTDEELLFHDPRSIHPRIDFDALKREGTLRFLTPPIFPFVIHSLGVTVTEDARLLGPQGRPITIETFEELERRWKDGLLPDLIAADHRLEKIQDRLSESYFRARSWLEAQPDGEPRDPDATIEVCDSLTGSGIPIAYIPFTEVSFTDTEKYRMSFWGHPEVEICNLFYYLYDRLGHRLLDADLELYLDVELRLQQEVAFSAKAKPRA